MFSLIIDYIKHPFNIYGVVSRGGPPSPNSMAGWAILKKPIMQKQCSVCLDEYWGRENANYTICGRFNCYRKSKSLKKHQIVK